MAKYASWADFEKNAPNLTDGIMTIVRPVAKRFPRF